MRVSISTTIVEAADHIAAFISGIDVEAFQKSEFLRSAVVQKLGVIGEAAARISEDLTALIPEVPWPQIVAFRNILIHAISGSTGRWYGLPPRIGARSCDDRSLASSRRTRSGGMRRKPVRLIPPYSAHGHTVLAGRDSTSGT